MLGNCVTCNIHTQRGGGGAKDVISTLFFPSLPQNMILTSVFISNNFIIVLRNNNNNNKVQRIKFKQFDHWQCQYLDTVLDFFFHSFVMYSVNPYKVNQPMGYRTCHNINV